MTALVSRVLTAIITLTPNLDAAGNVLSAATFAGTAGANQVKLSGNRMSSKISKTGQGAPSQLNFWVEGMSLALMNQLSTLGKVPKVIGKNTITLLAGDSSTGPVVDVFDGTILTAYTDLESAPEARFQITANAGLFEGMQAIAATSFKGSVDAVTVFSAIATKMGLANGFVNGFNGLSGIVLSNPYYAGDGRSQLVKCAQATGVRWIIDNNALVIWPAGGSRGGGVPLISPTTGLIGYPYPAGGGVLGLRTVFNPAITFGSNIQVESSITPANGPWTVIKLDHALDAELPNGKWETTIGAMPPGYLTNGQVPQ